jgi:hypothetical protein
MCGQLLVGHWSQYDLSSMCHLLGLALAARLVGIVGLQFAGPRLYLIVCLAHGDSHFDRSSFSHVKNEALYDWPLGTEEHQFFVRVQKSSQE